MQDNSSKGYDFEAAIAAVGFGAFNICLLLVSIPAISVILFDNSSISYIIASAECDLNLGLVEKGVLNSACYAGMIITVLPWAYISDSRGRKNVLVYGLTVDGVLILLSSFAQNFYYLVVCKFLSGLVICGPFATIMSYISELHGLKHRSRVVLFSGLILTLASLALPLLAMLILPHKWDIVIFGYHYHSWHVYLAVCSMPSFLGGIFFIFFPESPKFFMAMNRNEEAMVVFRGIYKWNHGVDDYPVRQLQQETAPSGTYEGESESILKILCSKEYLGNAVCAFTIYFATLMCQNTIRLWSPQLFATSKEFTQERDGDISFCSIIEYSVNKSENNDDDEIHCTVIISAGSYTDNFIVGLVSLIEFILVVAIVNKIGAKIILTTSLFVSSFVALFFMVANNEYIVTTCISLYLGTENIASMAIITATVNLFPTRIRTMIVAITMLFGRIGSTLGNLLFPTLMKLGCAPPVLWVFFSTAFAGCMSMLFPNTTLLPLP